LNEFEKNENRENPGIAGILKISKAFFTTKKASMDKKLVETLTYCCL
jgi:hypothetical protein